ncbi:hypothetical protein G3479_11455 [Shewanella baltica]|uniref:hypothetical protein n=1 Tax=Shewanella baltica TaxID=62322 RepID=UPI00217DB106|nr:hypothetical protein [Shewanella baltica]MCS6259863.1 hypothetical protein [Shewanella baltica]
MFHTSPSKIVKGSINKYGIAGSCLFFSDDVYQMSEASVFTYEAEFDCVRASQLHDDAIIDEIASYFDVDADTAGSLLDGSENEWDYGADADGSWWLQGKRGECAVKMGYDGCEDRDEQGTVYIVPMLGREEELKIIEVTL